MGLAWADRSVIARNDAEPHLMTAQFPASSSTRAEAALAPRRSTATRWPAVLSTTAALALIVGGAALSTVLVIATNVLRESPSPFLDWVTYSKAVTRVAAGAAPYASEQLTGPYHLSDVVLSGFAYPPPALLLFVLFGSSIPGLVLWSLTNSLALIAGLASVARHELGLSVRWALAVAVLALSVMPAFIDGMRVGNVNVGLAGLLAWTWTLGPGSRAVMSFAVVGASLKLFPALLAFWSVRGLGWRAIAIGVAGGGAILVLSVVVLGGDYWVEYLAALTNAVPECEAVPPSLTCTLEPTLGTTGARLAAGAAAIGLGLAASLVRSRTVGFVLLTIALLAPVADLWVHYRLFAFVALWVVLNVTLARLRRQQVSQVVPDA